MYSFQINHFVILNYLSRRINKNNNHNLFSSKYVFIQYIYFMEVAKVRTTENLEVKTDSIII